ncbi:hypothetical protein [Desulfosporosinus sp. SB140]|uniref:hypothetical protein n=1 Tax=Desulfosporosinus paludis TaxID=3115649 RepID=UPI00388EFEC9
MGSREYFIERYGNEYIKLIEHLESLITQQETGYDRFLAVGYEAGIGKSVETDRILSEYTNKHGDFGRKFLLVKRFVNDVTRSASCMNDNSTAGIPIALGITHDNWGEVQKGLVQIEMYPVVIITHSRYFRLSQDPYTREYFERGRHTLIIDEQLELPIYSYSEQLYREMMGFLPSRKLQAGLLKVSEGLANEITGLQLNKDPNRIFKARPQVDLELVKEFEADFNANYHHFKKESNRSKVDNFVKFLHCCIDSNECLFNNGRLATYNRKAVRWKLSNNLILDANAGIDRRYFYAPDIVVECPPKIIDHSDTTLYQVDFNTSKNSINSYGKSFFSKVCKLITDRLGTDDKTLIVTHYPHESQTINCLKELGHSNIGIGDKYADEKIAVAHFGAIIGQNYWRDFNKVWVIATPNFPYEVYPLQWIFFKGSPIRTHKLTMGKTTQGYSFHYAEFEDIRQGSVPSEIYQAIMRINREGRLKSEIYVVNDKLDVVKKVIQQLKNVKVGETIQLDVKKPKDENVPQKDTKASKFVNCIKGLSPGKYHKSYIYEKLGWKNDGHISDYLKDDEIAKMYAAGLIDWNQHYIIINPRTVAK